jgi:protein arginine kinase
MLLLEIQPAHLQLQAERELTPDERDIMRAEITRLRLQSIAPPVNVSHSESPPPTGGSFQETNDE